MLFLTLVEIVKFIPKINTVSRTTGCTSELNVEWEETHKLKTGFGPRYCC